VITLNRSTHQMNGEAVPVLEIWRTAVSTGDLAGNVLIAVIPLDENETVQVNL
jgi:hypothetical protein